MNLHLAALVNDCVELTISCFCRVCLAALLLFSILRYIISSTIHHRKEYAATFRKEEEESLTLSHLLNDNGNGGDHVDLATLGEREVRELRFCSLLTLLAYILTYFATFLPRCLVQG